MTDINQSLDELFEKYDVSKISRAHDLYSGMPKPFADGYREGFNTAKTMLKPEIADLILAEITALVGEQEYPAGGLRKQGRNQLRTEILTKAKERYDNN